MNRLFLSALLLVLASPAAADAPPETPLTAAVIADQHVGELHVLAPLAGSVSMPYMPSSGNILADALGGAIGGAIAQQQMLIRMQNQADAVLEPLLLPLGKAGVQPIVRRGIALGLERAGLVQRAMAYTRKADEEAFERLPGAKSNERWVVVDNGAAAASVIPRPIAISEDLRQFRVALRLEVLGDVKFNARRQHQRDVVYYSDPLPESAQLALAALTADDGARFRSALEAVVADAVAVAAADTGPAAEAGDDEFVDIINRAGAQRIPGTLVSHVDGRALIRGGDSLVSIPADVVLPAFTAAN